MASGAFYSSQICKLYSAGTGRMSGAASSRVVGIGKEYLLYACTIINGISDQITMQGHQEKNS
jgi:hypothetical protein